MMTLFSRSALILAPIVAFTLAVGCVSTPSMDPETARRLEELRNLGKAFYENPGSSQEAVDTLAEALALAPDSPRELINHSLAQLRAGALEEGMAGLVRAQQLDPSIPHTYFNLGIEYKKAGEAENAIGQFEKMLALEPDEAKVHYNLGQLYKQLDRNDEARAKFELAAELDPSLGAPHFQLYNLLRREDRDAARVRLQEFQRIKKLQDETDTSEDVDWSFFSELYDPIEKAAPVDIVDQPTFESAAVSQLAGGDRPQMLLLDMDADRDVDAVASTGTETLVLRNNDGELTAEALTGLRDVRGLDAGDADNDGLPELCAVSSTGAYLLAGSPEGFAAPTEIAEGDFEACLFHDVDHDNDYDLLLVGGSNQALRNTTDPEEGEIRYESVSFPFAEGKRGLAVVAAEFYEDNGNDVVVAYEDSVVVYQDRKLGRYDADPPLEGVSPGAAPVRLAVVDRDNDGLFDVALTSAEGETEWLANEHGTLSAAGSIPRTVVFIDLQNSGVLSPGVVGADVAAAASADIDGDGRADLLTLSRDGAAALMRNTTAVDNHWATLSLTGVKSAKLARGARVEVKAGAHYQKRLYQGAPLHFGLGGQESIDTVRITWTNGMIQNEMSLVVDQAHAWDEKPRLSGSCPMIYTWNGEEFEYISEVLGVAPLGASLGGGQFFPVDHDEYVFLRGAQLVPRDGFYEVRITEELREVAYLDQVRLLVLDHPQDVEIYSNEKFKAPPFPEFELFEVREDQKVRPTAATNHRGESVLDRVVARDGRTVDEFRRTFDNTAEDHSITLDLAGLDGGSDSKLFLTGWVDWAAASTIVGRGQTGQGITPPVLQVRDADGAWRTVIEDLGLPGGRPRTMVVDLTDKFLSDSREIRIPTNMCVYWDEIFAADGVGGPELARLDLDPASAKLSFRGFSKNQTHPERLAPENFVYGEVSYTTNWDPTPGNYTAYGDVRDLLAGHDDRLAVLGAGDEVRLRFEVPAGDPPAGWTRDFLLFVDGWAKENEANTAFGDTVEPLPFHNMSAYPYAERESYPHDDLDAERRTRPALRLTRPLHRR